MFGLTKCTVYVCVWLCVTQRQVFKLKLLLMSRILSRVCAIQCVMLSIVSTIGGLGCYSSAVLYLVGSVSVLYREVDASCSMAPLSETLLWVV